MKTASMLFGLVVATTGVVHANPPAKRQERRALPAGTRALLRETTPEPVIRISAQPLRDADGDLACGNVMSKGGSHRVCHEKTAVETAADRVLAAFHAPSAKSSK